MLGESHRVLGLPGSQFTDLEMLAHTHPDDVERVKHAWAAAFVHGQPYAIDYRLRFGDDWRWFSVRAEFERDARGRATLGLGVVHDITQRKQAELALHQLAPGGDGLDIGFDRGRRLPDEEAGPARPYVASGQLVGGRHVEGFGIERSVSHAFVMGNHAAMLAHHRPPWQPWQPGAGRLPLKIWLLARSEMNLKCEGSTAI